LEFIFGIIIIGILLWLGYKHYYINLTIPTSRIKEYLNKKGLKYIRHQKVKKSWNPNFESEETIFTSFLYRKHYYVIDAADSEENPVEINARWYQSMSFFHKNKVIFEIKKIEVILSDEQKTNANIV
jgi:hypothetical protein